MKDAVECVQMHFIYIFESLFVGTASLKFQLDGEQLVSKGNKRLLLSFFPSLVAFCFVRT